MDATDLNVPKVDVERLRDLLRRWLRLHESVLTPEEMTLLFDDTSRALRDDGGQHDGSSG